MDIISTILTIALDILLHNSKNQLYTTYNSHKNMYLVLNRYMLFESSKLNLVHNPCTQLL